MNWKELREKHCGNADLLYTLNAVEKWNIDPNLFNIPLGSLVALAGEPRRMTRYRQVQKLTELLKFAANSDAVQVALGQPFQRPTPVHQRPLSASD